MLPRLFDIAAFRAFVYFAMPFSLLCFLSCFALILRHMPDITLPFLHYFHLFMVVEE